MTLRPRGRHSRSFTKGPLLRAALTTTAVLVGTYVLGASLRRPVADRQADLHVYVGAARALLDHRGLYTWRAANGDPFTYPPIAGLLALPLTLLPEAELRGAWTVLAGGAALALARRLPPPVAPTMLLLLSSAPVQSSFRFGQVSLLLVALVVVAAAQQRQSRAGILIGLAAAVKLTPLVFVPYLWLTGRRSAAGWAAGTFGVSIALGAVILPAASSAYWLVLLPDTSRIGRLDASANQPLTGVLAHLHVPHPCVLLALGAVVCAGALLRAGQVGGLAGLAMAGTVGVVLSPVSWTHHQLWLLGLLAWPLPRRALWWPLVLVPLTLGPADTRGALALVAVTGAAGGLLRRTQGISISRNQLLATALTGTTKAATEVPLRGRLSSPPCGCARPCPGRHIAGQRRNGLLLFVQGRGRPVGSRSRGTLA